MKRTASGRQRKQFSCVDLSKWESSIVYSTGIASLDALLKGGFPSGTINELIGFTSSGKTYLAQSVLLRMVGQYNMKALILSNASPNTIKRSLRSILKRIHDDDPEIINYQSECIKIQSFSNVEELKSSLNYLLKSGPDLLATHKLLLIDGLSSEYLKQYMARDSQFQGEMSKILQMLRRLANDHNLTILCTNLIMTRNEVGNHHLRVYSEATNPHWSSFIDLQLLITAKKNATNSWEADVEIVKSRCLETEQICTLSSTRKQAIQ